MRVVIDTNVIVSGLYDPDSPPGRVLDAGVTGTLGLCAPEAVRIELRRVLREVLDYLEDDIERTLEALPVEWIEEEVYRDDLSEAARALRDPDDAPILACGFALGCDIVSGDKDLHAARQRRVRVWRPAELSVRR